MDSFWVIVLFILLAIFSDRKDKKRPVPKRRMPDSGQQSLPDDEQPGQGRRIMFEIPELRGAPDLPSIQPSPHVQTSDAILAEQKRYQEMLRNKKKKQLDREEEQSGSRETEQQSAVNSNTLQQAVIWSEILSKPKAYRMRRKK